MGAVLGGLAGLGMLLCLTAGRARTPSRWSMAAAWRAHRGRTSDALRRAGLPGVRPGQIVALRAALVLVVAVLVAAATGAWPVGAAFGWLAGMAPRAWIRIRARRHGEELRELWPDLVDNLASAVRAGLALPEALAEIGETGPERLAPAFRRFAEAYRVTGSFGASLDLLAEGLADPVGDRVVEALRLARDVGGSDVGSLLRTLSGFLREDARVRSEIEARQSWTVGAARLAVAAPWAVLLLLSTSTSTVRAYNNAAGALVLLTGGTVCWAAYRAMQRLGRLPEVSRG